MLGEPPLHAPWRRQGPGGRGAPEQPLIHPEAGLHLAQRALPAEAGRPSCLGPAMVTCEREQPCLDLEATVPPMLRLEGGVRQV